MATEQKKDKAADASINKAAAEPAKNDQAAKTPNSPDEQKDKTKDSAGRTKDEPSQNASTNVSGAPVGGPFLVTKNLVKMDGNRVWRTKTQTWISQRLNKIRCYQ